MRSTKYRFDEFELDPASRELLRGGERVALPPKSFECLAYLVSNRDRAVGRDELIAAVWARVEVSDTVVAQTLLRARKAIGDSGTQQHSIRTVSRFGYRWVAPVCETIPGTTHPPQACANQAHSRAADTRKPAWHGWWSLLVLTGVAALAGWLLPDRTLRAAQDGSLPHPAAMAPARGNDLVSAKTPHPPNLQRSIRACRTGLEEGAIQAYECRSGPCDAQPLSSFADTAGRCARGDASVRKHVRARLPRVQHSG